MLGARTPDGTYVWYDGDPRASGPRADYWQGKLSGSHLLPNFAAKAAFEERMAAQGRAVIAEPLDVPRPIQSLGEMLDVLRRLCREQRLAEPIGYVPIPGDALQ